MSDSIYPEVNNSSHNVYNASLKNESVYKAPTEFEQRFKKVGHTRSNLSFLLGSILIFFVIAFVFGILLNSSNTTWSPPSNPSIRAFNNIVWLIAGVSVLVGCVYAYYDIKYKKLQAQLNVKTLLAAMNGDTEKDIEDRRLVIEEYAKRSLKGKIMFLAGLLTLLFFAFLYAWAIKVGTDGDVTSISPAELVRGVGLWIPIISALVMFAGFINWRINKVKTP